MQKLTFEEISEILHSDLFEENDINPERWMHEDTPLCVDDLDEDDDLLKEQYERLGEIELVEQHGGEGEGDDYYTVYHFKDHDVWIQFQGWYASYHGSEYEEMFEVQPEQKLVTVYKPKN